MAVINNLKNMIKHNKQKTWWVVLGALCLATVLLAACGKKSDLYLPETVPEKVPAAEAPTQNTQLPTEPNQTDEQKKDQKKLEEQPEG